MKSEIKKYTKENIVSFSINISQKEHSSGKYKKDVLFPPKWTEFTLDNSFYNDKYNGIALLTGEVNNLIIIDIDNLEHWNDFLEENNQEEPDTVKVISGSGGLHFYFKYDKELETIKSKDHCFGKEFDIDIKTNGGCVIAPPTKYYNKNLNKDVQYKWEKSIFDFEPISVPKWIKKLLLKKTKKFEKTPVVENNTVVQNLQIDKEDEDLNFTIADIENILDILDKSRVEIYNDWLSVGMCLYNINPKYLLLWEKWSQLSNKYEDGICENKWKSFKKNKDGLKIGSLLLWAKNDNSDKYDDFMKKKKIGHLIKQKYPSENLILGDQIKVNDKTSFINLQNKDCLIKGVQHNDMNCSMYIDISDKIMSVRCKHPECFGKCYPCSHAITLTKNEMIIANNENVNIYINQEDGDFVEFQQIDIYDEPKVNEMVYNCLNGGVSQLAEIIYYYHENEFMYGEDDNWYMYYNHKWENIGKKNTRLRQYIQPKLKDIFTKLHIYYKENDDDKNKLKNIKNIIKSFGETTTKNNIIVELSDLYSEEKNYNRNFTKKLDSNNHLIGFNNGVFDLEIFQFRDGKPDDYITLSVGYDYSPQHTNKYDELLQFLQDIQPDKEERDYMLTYLSIGLIGNLLELFTILTGSGRNGKSKLIELLGKTLGEYFGSVQSQMFTRPRPDANSPDPGLLSLMKKRIVIASEPEKNSKLNS
jgi:hypothetical protein